MPAHSERVRVDASVHPARRCLPIVNGNELRGLRGGARDEPIRARNADRYRREGDQGGERQAEGCTGWGLVEGLVDMMDLRESRTTICRKALSRYRRLFVRTWAKPLMNKGDFVNLVNEALTAAGNARANGAQ